MCLLGVGKYIYWDEEAVLTCAVPSGRSANIELDQLDQLPNLVIFEVPFLYGRMEENRSLYLLLRDSHDVFGVSINDDTVLLCTSFGLEYKEIPSSSIAVNKVSLCHGNSSIFVSPDSDLIRSNKPVGETRRLQECTLCVVERRLEKLLAGFQVEILSRRPQSKFFFDTCGHYQYIGLDMASWTRFY